jgi:hypothetical protein
MDTKQHEAVRLTELSGPERRRSARVPLEVEIEVSGKEPRGKAFREMAKTGDVNEHGCRFELPRQLNRGDLVTLASARSVGPFNENKPQLFQIVWVEPGNLGWQMGAMRL